MSNTWRPVEVVVEGTSYRVHGDGKVYRHTGRGDRRVRDPHMAERVRQTFKREIEYSRQRRAHNRERFG